ncbi:MAG: O-antigen ligase family protein [Candidatus Binatia bacterium]
MQAVDTAQHTSFRGFVSVVGLVILGTLVALGVTVVGPMAVLPVFGVAFFALVAARPEYGIALFLSTFLMTYPAALQGGGSLTINNLLGGMFLILLSYKMYSEPDWWFLRLWEIRLLAFIFLVFYLADRFNGPDPRLLALLADYVPRAESPRTFLTRSVFTLFFINYIRTPAHVVMIYSLGIGFMIASALSGVQSVMHGTAAAMHGYRATTTVIAAAINPNRLAMFSIFSIAGLWYVMRSLRVRALAWVVLPVIPVLCLAVFMTGSRSGLLGLGVAGAAIMLDEKFELRQLLGFALAGLLVTVLVVQLVPQKTFERITNLPFLHSGETTVGNASVDRREYTWGVGLKMIEQHPFIGVGGGNWELTRYLSDPTHLTMAPHSSYILATVEGGLVCLLSYLALLWRTWRNFRYAEPYISAPDSPLASLRWVAKSAQVNLIVLVFVSAFADLWQLVILFWLIGLSVVLRRLVDQAALETVGAY